jgi:NAD(P)-dependent dehydrogenase (short-subunit alcohol dehydrogenase family)
MKLKPIQDQVVVIIGASSGIGRQTALDFAERGARVIAAARDDAGLQSLAQQSNSGGPEIITVVADTAEIEQVRAVADRAIEVHGRIDTWVQCAAVSLYATFEQTTPEEWRRIIDVNLNGQAYGAMVAIPHLRRAGGGALIHISSVEARRALPYQSAYAASKHGISGMLEALRLELEKEEVPISVTEIMPASINTPFFDKARTKLGVKPMGMPPIYQPKLVADAILHAAEHPIREFVVGGAGQFMKWTQEFVPSLANKILLTVGFEQQKTEQVKSVSAPNNLFGPMDGYDRVEGSFGSEAHASTPFNWIQKHPIASKLVFMGALTAAAAILLRDEEV